MATIQQQQDLFMFLLQNATELKLNGNAAVENRYKKLKQCNINYSDFFENNESNLREKLNFTELKPSQQSAIIRVLKQNKQTYIHDEANIHECDITNNMERKIVTGFIRNNYLNQNSENMDIDLPTDIIDVIFLFYHVLIREYFKHYNNSNYQRSNDKMTIAKKWTRGNSVCYGAAIISSVDGGIYRWIYKIRKRSNSMAIGIDDTQKIRKHKGTFDHKNGQSKSYALWHDGKRIKWDHDKKFKADLNALRMFNTNDTVTMILNLCNQTLSYKINDGKEVVVFKNVAIGHNIHYCMGVCIGGWVPDSVELIKCIHSK